MGDIVFGNKSGDTIYGDKHIYRQGPHRRDRDERRDIILLLGANPGGRLQLQLDQERRAIDQEVAYARGSARLDVRTADALRLDDLQRALLRYQPVIAHFSGHGHPYEGIQVLDEAGRPRSVQPAALTGLFGILKAGLRCVVLNACHTDEQAAAIAVHVPFVVGMRRQVLDDTAIQFAAGFYRGLAAGRTIRTSFALARNALDLHGRPDRDVPQLIAQPDADDRPIISG